MAVKKETSPKPTVGRIVHFIAENKKTQAAIITQVNSNSNVNLTLFADNHQNPLGYPTCLLENVEHGKGVGQWDWPQREGEQG